MQFVLMQTALDGDDRRMRSILALPDGAKLTQCMPDSTFSTSPALSAALPVLLRPQLPRRVQCAAQ